MKDKIAIISDIHGNLPALTAVLDDIKNRGINKIVCLGDLVGYYPFFNEVTQLIKERNIPTVMGNHDYALVKNNGFISYSKTCTKILSWQLTKAEKATLIFLKGLKPFLNLSFFGKSFYLVHAGLVNPIDEYLFSVSDQYLKSNNFNFDVLLTGHTHLPSFKKFYSGQVWLNPGSVGQPRDQDNRASYALVNEKLETSHVRVEYDFEIVINKMRTLNFDDYISIGLRTGKKIGLE